MNAENFLVHNLLIFARLLRDVGIDTSAEQVSDWARILQLMGLTQREDVYNSARALFVRRHADQAIFDRAFDLFFRIQGNPQQSVIAPTQAPAHRAFRPKGIQKLVEQATRGEPNASKEENLSEADQEMTYSAVERLRQKRFDQFTPAEILAARKLIASMNWRIGERRTRRQVSTSRGQQIDFERLIRCNLKYGVEFFQLTRREPRFKPRPLVVLADISGSMERYTRLIMHWLHAMSHSEFANLHVFLFGTRLTHITPDLKHRNVDDALGRVTQRVADWSGGTRIGDALKTFNFKWARRVLRSSSVVLILSDGWDCGDLELLQNEMARLQRSCFRLIWLNPLMSTTAMDGTTQGLQVALPFVDDLLPVYNLSGLEMLMDKLESLDETRPLRRQHQRIVHITPAIETPAKFMDLPQMGTSDYVRRTMMARMVNGTLQFSHEQNSS